MFLLHVLSSLVLLIRIPSVTALSDTRHRCPLVHVPRQVDGAQGDTSYEFYKGDTGAIRTDLMVGPTDGDGNRQPRNNCIFYTNQKLPMTEKHRDWAKKRAIEFSQLMNAVDPGGDYHTIYDVYNIEAAFNTSHSPMADALEAEQQHTWFQITSKEYATLCAGTVYLVTEAASIYSEEIWTTDEIPALRASGLVTQIVEIRPEEIGPVYDSPGQTARDIRHHPYRDGQPDGATPPSDTDNSTIPAGISVRPEDNETQKRLDLIGNIDVNVDDTSICPGYNYGVIDMGENGAGKKGYAVVDSYCQQVAGTITSNVCLDALFGCSGPPIQIITLWYNGQEFTCRTDPRAGRCTGVTKDVGVCCRNDGR